MYVIVLEYTAPLPVIDDALPDHVAWLEQQYAAGHFLASGRRDPRVGGVILATKMTEEEVETIVAADPFALRGLAEHHIVRFIPSKLAPELDALSHLFR